VIGWGSIVYGAGLSALAAAVGIRLLLRERRPAVLLSAAAAAAVGALAWNAILHRLEADEFFVDAPIAVFPVSWQDTGSAVFAAAAASVALGFGALRASTAFVLAQTALVCGLAALLVDVYLY
jgi:hypothetical protein